MAQKRQLKQPDPGQVVNKDIVFSENIRNEMKFFDKNRTEHFQLNPNRVVILAEKPNHIKPQSHQSSRKDKDNDIFGNPYTDDPVEEAFSNQKLEKTLELRNQIPRQKYNFPMTQNQEIGWFANQLNVYKPTKNFANQQCEITKFVDNYFEMTHENPFKKKRS
ncbi:unnamed protein product [Paramecium primaurelia]|uniref:Uncharacterized protein n=2 Tax=Paramecium TaxID=5884 RepID=A0A8S1VB17_9CILI|nr:unnamed protein product [Paramecium primaurelia]CAD8172096.1 unnamed protein product [Paramecium pentaurelia]